VDQQKGIEYLTATEADVVDAIASPTSSKSAVSTTGRNVAGVIRGDSATGLAKLPSECFNVAITSPPYYWVRDYGYDGQLGHEGSVEAYI
jgi:site-specific DNA-methyltransferase (adenine-specific)